ncbi:MAG TPA: TetR/AcrR family transcriptional regulator [Acidimicrobiales bacterium]|jgi:AcrR family transcriptional regulator
MSATGPAGEGKGARTRAAIQEAAVVAFRRDGYDRATLAGIAEELGITRSAVLHHFSSKAELLRQSVEPFFAHLDELLDRVESGVPIPDRQQRVLVTEVVDLVAEYRQVAAFLTSDPSVSSHLGPDLQLPARALRFVAITVGVHSSELAAVRSLAALGSVLRPLVASDDLVDFGDPATRQLLVACSMAVLQTPLPVSPGSAPSRDRAGS